MEKLNEFEEKLYLAILEKFPSMIVNKEVMWIKPISDFIPNIIKKLQELYELELILDDNSNITFLKPLYKK